MPAGGRADQKRSERLTFERCESLLERFVGALDDRLGDRLLAVALFGSVARGEGDEASDLDLLLVHGGESQETLARVLREARELRATLEYRTLRALGFLPEPAPVLLTRERLAEHPWLLLDVADHGIVLLDREGLLQRELDAVRQRLEFLGSRKVTLPDGSWYWDLKPDWKPGELVEL